VARRPREEAAGAIHHVIPKGSAGEAIVRDAHDRRLLLERVGETTIRHRWSCLAYCLLDTHLHLIAVTSEPNLGRGMQWLLAPYARYFNARHERQGNLFHSRVYSTRIVSDEHLIAALLYVYLNPVRASIAEKPETWPWSSYAATVGRRPEPDFVDTTGVLQLFDDRRESAQLRLQIAVAEARVRDHSRRVGV
jgi:REP element-mobilizing transposase RayT